MPFDVLAAVLSHPSPHVRLLLWSTGLQAADPTGGGTVKEALDLCCKPFAEYGYPLETHLAVKGEGLADGKPTLP